MSLNASVTFNKVFYIVIKIGQPVSRKREPVPKARKIFPHRNGSAKVDLKLQQCEACVPEPQNHRAGMVINLVIVYITRIIKYSLLSSAAQAANTRLRNLR